MFILVSLCVSKQIREHKFLFGVVSVAYPGDYFIYTSF
jgi:hypothetical protein